MSDETTGVGVTFLRWNPITHQWGQIARIKSIGGPNKTRNTHDITTLDSTGGYRDFIAGIRDDGIITLAMIFTRDEYETMNADYETDSLRWYQIVLPDEDETSLEFEGIVTELPLVISEEVITCNVSIKVSGIVDMESGQFPSTLTDDDWSKYDPTRGVPRLIKILSYVCTLYHADLDDDHHVTAADGAQLYYNILHGIPRGDINGSGGLPDIIDYQALANAIIADDIWYLYY
jgi:predicted secreted protein